MLIIDGDGEDEKLKSGIEIFFSYRIDEKCPIERGIFPHAVLFRLSYLYLYGIEKSRLPLLTVIQAGSAQKLLATTGTVFHFKK